MKSIRRLVFLFLCVLICLTALPAMASEVEIGTYTWLESCLMPEAEYNYLYAESLVDEFEQVGYRRVVDLGIKSSADKAVRYFLYDGMSGLEFTQDHTKIIIPANYAGICEIAVTDATLEEIKAGPVRAALVVLYVYPAAPRASLFCFSKNTVNVSWNPIRNVTGYCVDYSYNSDMSYYQTIEIQNPNITYCKISNLEAGKQVYVRVRSYVANEDGWWINGYDQKPKSIFVPRMTIWNVLDLLFCF